jgi:hypothetical protein
MTKLNWVVCISLVSFTHHLPAQICGCTDPLATNYDVSATTNDGGCMYDEYSIEPASSYTLEEKLTETSGLIQWNSCLWTINDSEDTTMYALDTANGEIVRRFALTGIVNNDCEELSQDDDFIYIGDFGNNLNGNRTDLHILRITKSSLAENTPLIDTICFSYANQSDFTAAGSNNTDFDCEAFIVSDDSLYLFTKQWLSYTTSVYALPKIPGTYKAQLKSEYDVEGLITGATWLPSEKLVVLTGYSSTLYPFLYLLYDFNGTNFFGGNKRKVELALPYHQVEGISTADGLKYYISNEYLSYQSLLTIPQQLHVLHLDALLGDYISPILSSTPEILDAPDGILYPVPSDQYVYIKNLPDLFQDRYRVSNLEGHILLSGRVSGKNPCIDIAALSEGLYMLKIGRENGLVYKLVKK